MKFQTADVIQKNGNKEKDYCALCERHVKSFMSSSSCHVCSRLLFLNKMALLRLMMVTLRILLHVMSMLAKLMCALNVTFFMKAGLTEITEDDYEDASLR